jgi:hypothetical protein
MNSLRKIQKGPFKEKSTMKITGIVINKGVRVVLIHHRGKS